MSRYIFRRLLMLVPVVLGVALFIFAVMDFTPGDPAVMILGEGATEAEYSALHAKLGLNDPLLVRYARTSGTRCTVILASLTARGCPCFRKSPRGCPTRSYWPS